MHNIDLSKYEVRTDMMVDLVGNDNSYNEEVYDNKGVKITKIKLDLNNKLGRKPGCYLTLEFNDITDSDNGNIVSEVLKEELQVFLKEYNYKKDTKTTIIGLGNIKSTPDSLGPLVSEKIITTKHLFDLGEDVDENYSCVSSFYPGVTGVTGIETYDYIKGVIDNVKPDLIIIIDALASSSISRVNKSIQISTTGINPGSGIGNKRKELSKETLGVPVLSLGVPTVTSASVIVNDTINYMIKNYEYNKRLENKKISKLVTGNVNYLKKDVEVKEEDKKTFLGLIGTLSKEELEKLVLEVLTPIGYNLMVTPKEVDFIIKKLSDIISYAINHTLHNI